MDSQNTIRRFVKVCGLRQKDNILKIKALGVDFLGLIFYEKSPRFVDEAAIKEIQTLEKLPFVGVFVNESIEKIIEKIEQLQLVAVQLHGNESPLFIVELRKQLNNRHPSTQIFKAFGINQDFDFQQLTHYEKICDLFIFDTKTPMHGGSGLQYDWAILQNYSGEIPFLLSGGIGLEDVNRVLQFQHPQFAGVDLNSRFEISPAEKDIEKLSAFIKLVK